MFHNKASETNPHRIYGYPSSRPQWGRARSIPVGLIRHRGKEVVEDSGNKVGPHNPSFAELIAALKALQPSEPSGISKHISTIIVAAAVGIGAWLLTGLSNVQSTLGSVATSIEAVQISVGKIEKQNETLANQQAAMEIQQAKLEQRVTALEDGRPVRP